MITSEPSAKITVALCRYPNYNRQELKSHVAGLVEACGRQVRPGMRLLLKPNLVAASRHHDLACTHPQFVAAVAEYFIDCGAKIRVGDSPATGGGLRAMRISGMAEALAPLAVELAEFNKTVTKILPCGIKLQVAQEALECDALINLPKVKAHNQLRITLAMKNYFGVVKGWRKVLAHQLYGRDKDRRFIELLLELPDILPDGISIIDGIEAMHVSGPIHGKPFKLGLLGASCEARALDTALLDVLEVNGADSALWLAAAQKKLSGTSPEHLLFPLARPEELRVENFRIPANLDPVYFSLNHVRRSLVKRGRIMWLRIFS